ncbi:MAG: LysR family transcriptional regulator [Polyangiaceae bacterium]
MTEPDWNDFKVILALASGGSLAGAARALGVDSSTVSRRLATLEDGIGAQLIVRRGQKFAWTTEGRAMLGAAEAIQATVLGATRSVQATKLGTSAVVRVSCPPGFIAALTRLMAAVRELRPDLTLEVCGENRAVDLARGEADLALRMFRPSDPDLICRQAFETGWCVYASQTYLSAHGTPTSPDELVNHRLVRYVSNLHKVPGPRWLEEHRGDALGSVQVDNTEVASHVVASGGGISVIPCVVAEERPGMVRVFADPVAYNTGWLVYHESARDTARVRAAVDTLAQVFETHRRVFSGRAA